MASKITPGTVLRLDGNEYGLVAVKMAPSVTAGEYFVIDPIHGGYYATGAEVPGIEENGKQLQPQLDADAIESGTIEPSEAPSVS